MPIGPTGVSVSIDGYTSSSNSVGSAVALTQITSIAGISVESNMVDATALGQALTHMVPTGVRTIGDVTIEYIVESGSSGTHQRIGPPAHRADYPARTLLITLASGMSWQIECRPTSRRIELGPDNVQRGVAVLQNAGTTSGSLVETGL